MSIRKTNFTKKMQLDKHSSRSISPRTLYFTRKNFALTRVVFSAIWIFFSFHSGNELFNNLLDVHGGELLIVISSVHICVFL